MKNKEESKEKIEIKEEDKIKENKKAGYLILFILILVIITLAIFAVGLMFLKPKMDMKIM